MQFRLVCDVLNFEILMQNFCSAPQIKHASIQQVEPAVWETATKDPGPDVEVRPRRGVQLQIRGGPVRGPEGGARVL